LRAGVLCQVRMWRSFASWRGCPGCTSMEDAYRVFNLARLSKSDVFCDLGCGHGMVCIWAAPHCRLSIGIESLLTHARIAEMNVREEGIGNVRIIRDDFIRHPPASANVLYCTIDLPLRFYDRLLSCSEDKRLRLVNFGPPPVPVKPTATDGLFCLTQFPFELAETTLEWCSAVAGKEGATWRAVATKYGAIDAGALAGHKLKLKRVFNAARI